MWRFEVTAEIYEDKEHFGDLEPGDIYQLPDCSFWRQKLDKSDSNGDFYYSTLATGCLHTERSCQLVCNVVRKGETVTMKRIG